MTFISRLSTLHYNYKIIDSNLEKVSSNRYLGVHLTPNLSWNNTSARELIKDWVSEEGICYGNGGN